MKDVKNDAKGVDFKVEVEKLLSDFNFKNKNSESALVHLNKAFKKFNQQFILVANLILGEGSNISDLYDVPFIEESKNKDELLLAMFIQNCQHDKNSDRVKAVADKEYVEIMDDKLAYEFLSKALR